MDVVAATGELRRAGLRVTRPRLAVLVWLEGHAHATADMIVTGTRAASAPISVQAVYDVVRACEHAGLVRRIELPGHPARFERTAGDNHHHVVCRRCGRTENVDCVAGSAPCLDPDEDHGFAVDEAEIVFWGLCPDCTGTTPAAKERNR